MRRGDTVSDRGGLGAPRRAAVPPRCARIEASDPDCWCKDRCPSRAWPISSPCSLERYQNSLRASPEASALIVFVMTGIVPAVYVFVQGTLFLYLNYKVVSKVAQSLVVSPRRPSGATWMAVISRAMTEDGS